MLCRRLAGVLAVIFVVQSLPGAAICDEIQLKLLPDGDPNPDDVSIWESASPTHLGATLPITYGIPWPQPDMKREFDIEAKWASETEGIGLKLYKTYLGRSYEIPIPHRTLKEDELIAKSRRCANNSATSFAPMLDDYYLCREVFYQAPDDSYAKLRAAKGWFDTAYRLAVMPNSPIRWDEQIARIMQGFEDRATWDAAFSARYRNVVRRDTYVGDFTHRAGIAELHLSRSIGDLISAGKLEDALALNRYVWNLYSRLRQETGETTIDGVNEQTFIRNDTDIRSKMEAAAARAANGAQDSP